MKKENKKIAILFGVLLASIVLVFVGSKMETKTSIELAATHAQTLSSNEKQAIYIGRPTCSYCQLFEPILQEMKERYNFNYYYINTDEITKDQLAAILEKIGIDPNEFGTPYIAFMENGKMVDKQIGYVDAETFFPKLKENKYVSGEYEKAPTLINYVNYKEYENIKNGDEKQILIFGRTTCTYCIQLKPILEEILKENKNLVINYIETDLMETEEEFNKLMKDAEEFFGNEKGEWGTPSMIILSKGTGENVLSGLRTKEDYITYFKENNFIK